MTRTKPYHLLIADDDPDFREVLRSIFEPWFALMEAASGEQAVEIVEGERVDLVLLDMNMERLTGLETIRIVKQIDQRLPCILVTGDFDERLQTEALQADAWSVLPKPVRKQELIQTVSLAIDSTYGDPNVFSGDASMN
ncbi:MAG: response regulator [Planctomycetota bacterium]